MMAPGLCMDSLKASRYQQARTVVALFGSAFGVGVLILALLAYRYSPTGGHLLDQVLVSPNLLPDLVLSSSIGERLKFDRIEYSFVNNQTGRPETVRVSESSYRRFYDKVAEDGSDGKEREFPSAGVARLLLWLRPAGESGDKQLLQEVQFSPEGSLYRVLLFGESPQRWIYFAHPGIYQESQGLFAP